MTSHPQANIIATAGTSQRINIWDIRSGVCLTSLKGHTHRIRAITFNFSWQIQ